MIPISRKKLLTVFIPYDFLCLFKTVLLELDYNFAFDPLTSYISLYLTVFAYFTISLVRLSASLMTSFQNILWFDRIKNGLPNRPC